MAEKQLTITVALISNEKGEVLLGKRPEPELIHAHGKWEFIGGGIDFGETPTEALKREVREEAGVEIEIIRLLPEVLSNIWTFPNGNSDQVLILAYECKIVSGKPKPNMAEAISELKFFTVEEVEKLDALPKTYEIVKLLTTTH